MAEPHSELASPRLDRRSRRLRELGAFCSHLRRRVVADNSLETASVLSFATLLAVVPLAAVVLAVLTALPVFERLATVLEEFVFRHFLPAAGEVVQHQINEFVERAWSLSLIGTAVVVATALLLVSQVEAALNRIWRVRQRRSPAARLAVYCAVLTLGPLLIGSSLALSTYLLSIPLVEDAVATVGAGRLLLELVPFAVTVLAFTLAYVGIPSCKVRWRAALAGGFAAAGLFEVAKRGFAVYLSRFGTYELIYGALAAVPIFLAWIYLSWMVILLGASFAASLEARPSIDGNVGQGGT